MAGFANDVVFANNGDFSIAGSNKGSATNGLNTNGQMWIGTTATNVGGTHINVGTVTSPDNSITLGYSSPNITAIANASMTAQKLTGNTGVATPSLGNINVVTSNATTKFVGSGSTLTQDFGLNNLVLGSSSPSITTATFNTGLGNTVLASLSSGTSNTCVGYGAGNSINTSNNNTLIGSGCGDLITTSAHNTAVGTSALGNLATGVGDNVAVGFGSLDGITTGTGNTCVGNTSGSAYTTSESGNIIIGPVSGTIGESNITRIGVQASQTKCFIAGITGNTVSSPQMVTINSSTGQVGVASSTVVRSVVTQIFTADGTYTPTSGMLYCIVEVVGGGGGGGGVSATSAVQSAAAGGGAGGGYGRALYSAATIGASQSITIGAGGTAGASTPANGGTGGTTLIGGLMQATGGGGGTLSNAGVLSAVIGGTGGIGAGGTMSVRGTAGESGFSIFSTTGTVISGRGGNSVYGGGAVNRVAANTGVAGGAYGGGGSGACATTGSGAAAGGAGASGIVIITEFVG